MKSGHGTGVALILLATIAFGVQYPVFKAVLATVDAFNAVAVRNMIAIAILVTLLVLREGPGALRYEGRFVPAASLAMLGMSLSPSLVFWGLMTTRPEVASVVVATQPAMTALAEWVVRGQRPAGVTLACIAVAFVGVITVVTGWSLDLGPLRDELWGDFLIFVGSLCWVVFVMYTTWFSGWSALRFTTLTMVPGAVGCVALAAAVTASGAFPVPDAAQWRAALPGIAFLSVVCMVFAMVMWSAGIQRIGALNAMLVYNLVPVVTYGIRAMQGHPLSAVELGGAALVIGALVVNNLYLRRRRLAMAVA